MKFCLVGHGRITEASMSSRVRRKHLCVTGRINEKSHPVGWLFRY